LVPCYQSNLLLLLRIFVKFTSVMNIILIKYFSIITIMVKDIHQSIKISTVQRNYSLPKFTLFGFGFSESGTVHTP